MLIKAEKRGFNTSKKEIKDLTKAWIILSLAFAIATKGFSFNIDFFYSAAIAAITVGLGFIVHELSHKIMAQKYGCFAEFRSFDTMLIFSLLISFTGLIFLAPGAV